jgi:creatinine amidohydrolase/Fe(II)-dependent formamide hydrolase-like protein
MSQFKNSFKREAGKGLLIVSMVIALSSCSSFSDVVDSTGKSLASVGDSLQSITGHVQVVQVSEDVFDLAESYHEPVTNFDSWSMRVKAKQVCNEGYVYQSRHAIRTGEFATNHVMCAEGESCGYALEWRIQCKKVPYEPFSLFGKT